MSKERLVELLNKFKYDCLLSCKNGFITVKKDCDTCVVEQLADYLIANGVIVPPCKVGQVIYYHFQFSNKSILPFTRKAKVRKICCLSTKMKFYIEVELIDAKEKGIMKFFDFDDFGKTVFPTREEAEKALEDKKYER